MPETPKPKHAARPLPNGRTVPEYRGKHRRRAAWTALLATISLVTGVTSSVLFAHTSDAGAGTTTISMFAKTGTDASTGSTAAVGSPGTANPGDVLGWALNYENTSGQPAHLRVTDPIVGQDYQPNSLRTPPGISGTFDPSTNTITASGDVSAGTTAAVSGPFPVATTNFTTPGGDGFTVEGYGSNIYTVYHHNRTSTRVFCATLQNTTCPGWNNVFASWVNAVPGTTLGQPTSTDPSPSDFVTAGINGSFIVKGRLYWPEQELNAGDPYPVGIQCLDLTTVTSCGFTRLDTIAGAAANGPGGGARIVGDGLAAGDGHYYYLDPNGLLLCFDPSTGSGCGKADVTNGVPVVESIGLFGQLLTFGSHVFASYLPRASAGQNWLTCYDVAKGQTCSSFPKSVGASQASNGHNYASDVVPVLSSTGALLGACAAYDKACYDTSGQPMSYPYPIAFFGGFDAVRYGTGVVRGARYYSIVGGSAVGCFDFAARTSSTALVPACAGFKQPTDSRGYTVRELANLPDCMAADGDAGQIVLFNAMTGGHCVSAAQQVTLHPADYYCDGQPGHVNAWGTLSLTGLSGTEYSSATIRLLDANGNPVQGFDPYVLPAGQTSVALTAIPVTGATSSLTAIVTLNGVLDATKVSQATVRLTWRGDPIQVCFQTKVPPVPCGASATPVSNTATATTTVGTDSEVKTSGPVVFDVSVPASACHLHFAKTASVSSAQPDDRVTYQITVKNDGTQDYPNGSFTDDLSDVLDDATLVAGSCQASSGTVDCSQPPVLTWAGSLAAGAQAVITYDVIVNRPDTGNYNMVNTVESPNPSNCERGSTDMACSVTVPVGDLTVAKTSSPASGDAVVAGQTVKYSLTLVNHGAAPVPVEYTDDLSDVLDDATLTTPPTVSPSGLTVTFDPATSKITISGTAAPHTQYVVEYEVTVNADGQRGNDDLINFLFAKGTPPPTECTAGSSLCTEHPVTHLTITKTQSTTAPPAPGDKVGYTITITNDGGLAYTDANPATASDDLSGVLDDATYNADAVSTAGVVTFDASAARLTWTGPIPVGGTVTITYSVTYTSAGNTELINTACLPQQGIDPNCSTVQLPGSKLTVHKSVDPASGTKVHVGDFLDYSLIFENGGDGAADVQYTDYVGDVLDDATLVSGPEVSDSSVTATLDPQSNTIAIAGTVAGNSTVTVTYRVRVNAWQDQTNHVLNNYLVVTGHQPPHSCVAGDPLCTTNPEPPRGSPRSPAPTARGTSTSKSSGTAFTGVDSGIELIFALLFLGLGVLLVLAGRRRGRRSTW